MKARRLGAALSLDRLARCRALFKRPLKAHMLLAGSRGGPFTLELRGGGVIEVPSYRLTRRAWTYLLSDRVDPRTIRSEGGNRISFGFGERQVHVRLDASDFGVFEEICLNDCYGLARLPDKLGTVVDLGANVGLFSASVAGRAERVVAVEPVPQNLPVARANLEPFGERVSLETRAVTGHSGETLTIHLGGISGCFSSRAEVAHAYSAATGSVEVETVSLGDLFEQHGLGRVDLLKCDVEGGEFPIFAGAGRDVLERVDRVVMEVHVTKEDEARGALPALREQLAEAGLPSTLDEELVAPPQGVGVTLLRAARA